MFVRSTISYSLFVLIDNPAANMMKAIAPVAVFALFLGSVVAAPIVAPRVPDVVTIGHWTGALEVSVPSKRTAEPEPGYDLSAWSGSHHVAIEGRKYDLSAWQGATEVSVEGREAEKA